MNSSSFPILLTNTTTVIGIHNQENIYNIELQGISIKSFIQSLSLNNDINKDKLINDKPHGKGKLYNNNDIIIYDGELVNGKMEGKGKCFLEEGIYYIGEFSNDKMHGKGVMYNKNDNIIYDGEFSNGQREGKGKFIS